MRCGPLLFEKMGGCESGLEGRRRHTTEESERRVVVTPKRRARQSLDVLLPLCVCRVCVDLIIIYSRG